MVDNYAVEHYLSPYRYEIPYLSPRDMHLAAQLDILLTFSNDFGFIGG